VAAIITTISIKKLRFKWHCHNSCEGS